MAMAAVAAAAAIESAPPVEWITGAATAIRNPLPLLAIFASPM
jgi:hypothetical protein